MLTYDAAIHAADRAAGAVWKGCQGPQAFGWRDGFNVRAAISLAQFVAANRAAPARDLYRFATAGREHGAQPFERVPPALRVAVETFRATFLVLLQELEKAAAVAVLLPPVEPVRPVELKAREDAKLRSLEDAWTRDDGRPAKRQPKAHAPVGTGQPKGQLR